MIGFPCQLANRPVLRRRDHPVVHHILIRVKRGVLPVRQWNLGPQALGTLSTPIPHLKGNHLACVGVHGNPDPLLVGFLLYKAGHFIRFHLQALDHDLAVTRDGLDVEMIRQGFKALHQKAQ
jgi:hypothetical protein